LHLYGKDAAKPGRKMGHFCTLADSAEAAEKKATSIINELSAS
jgi:5-(carboxyamino)imidazole ribonucleotide synthase